MRVVQRVLVRRTTEFVLLTLWLVLSLMAW